MENRVELIGENLIPERSVFRRIILLRGKVFTDKRKETRVGLKPIRSSLGSMDFD